MNNEEYKPTEYFDPQAYGRTSGVDGWSNPSSSDRKKTEVLRPKGPKVYAMLVGMEGPPGFVGQVFRLNSADSSTLGRDFSCDVVIDESSISRYHAKIRLDKKESGELQFFIQDLATENGTMVNDKEIVKHYLVDGDRITIGRATLVFKQV